MTERFNHSIIDGMQASRAHGAGHGYTVRWSEGAGVLTDAMPFAGSFVSATAPPPSNASSDPPTDKCPVCGGDAGDNWFDRSICPEPCDMMHTRCVTCGTALDGCRLEQPTFGTLYDPAMKLASIKEIAEICGTGRRTAARYVDRDDFPTPIGTLGVGRIWLYDDVVEWAKRLPLRTGRPPNSDSS